MRQLSDHQQARREDVIDCAWRVIIRDGVDRASIRSIAHELGGTTGIVTHYFRDKEELILFALDRVMTSMWRVEFPRHQADLTFERFLKSWLKILPTSNEAQDGWRVWTAFIGYAVGRDNLMMEYRKQHLFQIEAVAKDFAKMREFRVLDLVGSDEEEAIACLALIDGLGTAWVVNPERYTPAVFRRTLELYFQPSLTRL